MGKMKNLGTPLARDKQFVLESTSRKPMTTFPLKRIASCFTALALMGASALAQESPYRLVLAEEFQATELNRGLWTTTMAFIGRQGARQHNDSYLSYTTDEDVQVGDGTLRLIADRRTVTGEDPAGTFHYTQGFVSTHDAFSFTYGYVEVRAKMPGGRGLWPTIWLMPLDHSWPPEFDIAEYYATTQEIRFGLATGTMTEVKWDDLRLVRPAVEQEWHTYGLIWEPGRAVWLFDGQVVLEVIGQHVPAKPMYLILNNGVSSRVGPSGAPDETTVFPSTFEIDYVRVYQRKGALHDAWPVESDFRLGQD
jgi:beta-glucanase (GH16 family)